MNKEIHVILLRCIFLVVTCQPFTLLSQVQTENCIECGELDIKISNRKLKANVKTIKTYKHKAYQHWLSSFSKEDEIWKDYKETQKDKIVLIEDEKVLNSEIILNENGQIIKEIGYNDQSVVIYTNEYEFDKEGKCIRSSEYSEENKRTQTHNIRKVSRTFGNITYLEQINNGPFYKYSVDYDDDDAERIKSVTKTFDGKIQTQYHFYEYDSTNNLVKQIQIDSNIINPLFSEHQKKERIYNYNDIGCLIEKKELNYIPKISVINHYKYSYDSNGCLNKLIIMNESTGNPKIEYHYNNDMTIKTVINYFDIASIKYEVIFDYNYTFDEQGNWIKKEEIKRGEQLLKDLIIYTRRIEYN